MKKATRNMMSVLVFFFLSVVTTVVFAEEKVPLASISDDEVMTWEEKIFIERLDNGMYFFKFINPDPDANIKVVFGVVDVVLTQATPTFKTKPVLHQYLYTENDITYQFNNVDGEYIGGPIVLPSYMEGESDDEECKPEDPSKSPPPPKEKEVMGGTGEKMYS